MKSRASSPTLEESPLGALAETAVREVNAIAARPYRADAMLDTDPERALAELRVEMSERRAEMRQPLDRLVYKIRCRFGVLAAEEARAKCDELYRTALARFDEATKEIAHG